MVVAKKDYNLPKHPEIEEATNLEVIKLMTSLTSRDLVTCRFSWKYYYWFLTEAGIECAAPFPSPPPPRPPFQFPTLAGRALCPCSPISSPCNASTVYSSLLQRYDAHHYPCRLPSHAVL